MTGRIESGDEYVRRILDGDLSDVTYTLVQEVWRGYPVERVAPLLSSLDSAVVRRGAWILSELADKAAPLIEELVGLLGHPDSGVRAYSVDAINLCAGRTNGRGIPEAVLLLEDLDVGVRVAVMNLMAWNRVTELSAVERLPASESLASAIRWLTSQELLPPAEIRRGLESESPLVRRVAAVAAVRAARTSEEPLRYAATLNDPDIAEFADLQSRMRLWQRPSRSATLGEDAST